MTIGAKVTAEFAKHVRNIANQRGVTVSALITSTSASLNLVEQEHELTDGQAKGSK